MDWMVDSDSLETQATSYTALLVYQAAGWLGLQRLAGCTESFFAGSDISLQDCAGKFQPHKSVVITQIPTNVHWVFSNRNVTDYIESSPTPTTAFAFAAMHQMKEPNMNGQPYSVVSALPAILWPLYRSTCVSRHTQLRTGGFCWSKVLLPTCPCWQQLVHFNYGADARVLLNRVTCTISVLQPQSLHQITNHTPHSKRASVCEVD